jgi:hypothetical protein
MAPVGAPGPIVLVQRRLAVLVLGEHPHVGKQRDPHRLRKRDDERTRQRVDGRLHRAQDAAIVDRRRGRRQRDGLMADQQLHGGCTRCHAPDACRTNRDPRFHSTDRPSPTVQQSHVLADSVPRSHDKPEHSRRTRRQLLDTAEASISPQCQHVPDRIAAAGHSGCKRLVKLP